MTPNGLFATWSAIGIGKLEDTSSIPKLRKMVADDTQIDVRFSAAVALEALGDDLGFEYIHRSLFKGDAPERRMAALAIGKIREGSKVESLIEVLSKDEQASVRAAAALALEKLRAREAVNALRSRVRDKDEDPDVKMASIHALSVILKGDAEKAVLPALGDPDVLVRCHAGAAVLLSRAGAGAFPEAVDTAPSEEDVDDDEG